MSSHSSHVDWKWGDEIPDTLVPDLIECTRTNLAIGINAFATMCPADQVAWCAYCFLSARQAPITQTEIAEVSAGAGNPEQAERLLTDIITALNPELLNPAVPPGPPSEPEEAEG
jgi:hypothetical protein